MTDQRNHRRFDTYKPAHIVLESGAKLVRCVLRDLSSGGAAAEISGDVYVPRTFDLLFEAEETKRVIEGVWRTDKRMVVRPCAIAWRNGVRLGAKFL
jgi:hypothetical protein